MRLWEKGAGGEREKVKKEEEGRRSGGKVVSYLYTSNHYHGNQDYMETGQDRVEDGRE